jgi:3-oxoacyl-[acyl-carrier protein] reductase
VAAASLWPAGDGVSSSAFGDLSGRKSVVTGASSGIGRAIALEFARAGADVVIHCRQSQAAAEKVAAEIREIGRSAEVLCVDLGQTDALAGFVDAAWACFGHVDVWVNNAGADLLTGDESQWSFADKLTRLLDVDVRSSLLLSRSAGERMAAAERGVILNLGWDQAERGMGGESGELFAASKNAVMGFTRSQAVSLAPHVRVNCLAPGWVRTAWGEQAGQVWQERVRKETPMGRWGTPEDVAKLARFLASDDADFITGQVIRINGGAVR